MVTVRQADPKDADMAVNVVRRSITQLCTADHHNDANTLATWLANKTPQNFLSWFANTNNFCVVAEANDRLLGVALLHRNGEISLFYVAPAAQRRGIGNALHAAIEERANLWGLRKLHLESTALARPFYEGLGYQPVGAAKPRFGVLRCYPYEKTLQPNPLMQPTGRERPAADQER
jgi:GNAT superfamily N-acetyltransferase